VVLEPGISEDHALLSEVRDSKECPLRVSFVMEDYIYHFGDLTCLVRKTIYIIHWYGAGNAPGTNTFIWTKSLSMKLPIAPESKSALTECTSLVSVVLIFIERMIDIP